MQEFFPDPFIQAHGLGYVKDIGANCFSQGCYFIDVRDFHCQEGIRCVFDQLSRFNAGVDNRRIQQEQRPINLAHQFFRALGFRTNYNSVRAHEVFNAGPFTQELRVAGHVKFHILPQMGFDNLGQCSIGAHRNSAFGDDDFVAVHKATNFFAYFHNKLQISLAAARHGSLYGNHHNFRILHAFG